jgi:hypothetical protein
MKLFEYLDRINKIHGMVANRRTGTPNEFAGRLGMSRTSLYEMIDELRSRGAPILYSKSSKTFYYSEPFDVRVSCSFRALSESESRSVTGGANLFPTVLFFRTLRSEFYTYNSF